MAALTKNLSSLIMYSHYADQHRGICIGYRLDSVSELAFKKLKYSKSRDLQINNEKPLSLLTEPANTVSGPRDKPKTATGDVLNVPKQILGDSLAILYTKIEEWAI